MKIIFIILLLFIAAVLGAGYYMFSIAILRKGRKGGSPDSADPVWSRYKSICLEGRGILGARPHSKVGITSRDGLKLVGWWYPADSASGRTAVIVHGFTSSSQEDPMLFAPEYIRRGWNVLAVDDRAHGESEGRYLGFSCLDRLDIVDWCRFVEERQGAGSEIVLHGISMGAASVLCASGEAGLPEQVKCVIADCGFDSIWNEFMHNLTDLMHIPLPGLVLRSAELWCRILAGYGFREHTPIQAVARTSVPILFIHGENDSYVPPAMSERMHAACDSYSELYICPGAIHAVSRVVAPEEYERRVAGFISAALRGELSGVTQTAAAD